MPAYVMPLLVTVFVLALMFGYFFGFYIGHRLGMDDEREALNSAAAEMWQGAYETGMAVGQGDIPKVINPFKQPADV